MFADPLFWLALSLILVATSLITVLLVAIPALRELSRAARSAEKLFDTLGRDLPPTLEALRQTGRELTDLTEDLSDGVQNAGRVVQQVDQSLMAARQQAQTLQTGSKSFLAGAKAAWQTWANPPSSSTRRPRPKKLGHQRSALAAPARPSSPRPQPSAPPRSRIVTDPSSSPSTGETDSSPSGWADPLPEATPPSTPYPATAPQSSPPQPSHQADPWL